ncbi:hypothetical protein [Streptomyces sp. NPDC058279]|uniref:hypothetical protein n=1 Tax=Streptomyces sp. NPDC058279 TaxID=3346418 RepID=UPI0036EB06EE
MGEIASGGGGRPGAPWGELKGKTKEANDLAEAMRRWLDASGLRVGTFHKELVPEHFSDGRIPSLDTLYSRFAGVAPSWEFVSAVVQICSPDAVTMNERQREVKRLWARWEEASRGGKTGRGVARRNAPIVEVPDGPTLPVDASSDQRLIAAYEKIHQMYEARLIATESHHRLELLLFVMIGREHDHLEHIARLEQQLGTAMEQHAPDAAQIAGLRTMIEEAEARENQLLRARDKAETERNIAQQMLEHANRRIAALQEEIEKIRAGSVAAESAVARVETAAVDVLHDVDGAIGQIQRILEEEHDQLYRLRQALGWRLVDDGDRVPFDSHTIAGEVVDTADSESPTTPDNSLTRQVETLEPPDAPDNPDAHHTPSRPTQTRSPAVRKAQRIRQTTAPAARALGRHALATVRSPRRLTVLVATVAWAIVVGSAFTEIRRGSASLLSMFLSALVGLLLLGCCQRRVRTVVSHGVTRDFDSVFLGTTTRKVHWYQVRTPTLAQAVGLLPSLIAPEYLGPLNTLGQELARLIGMA